jgi:hypothetical protein
MERFDAIHPTGVAANQNGSIIPGEGLIPVVPLRLSHQRERALRRLAEELRRIKGPMTG